MDEIAKHIHKAKGALYYYYNSKEALYNEVLKRELASVKDQLAVISEEDSDSLVMMKKYVLTRLKLLYKAKTYHETLKADFFEKYYFVKDVRTDFENFEHEQLVKILNKGKDDGYLDVKDIDSTVSVLLMILNGIEIPFFLQNKYPEYENTLQDLSNMLVDSLKSQK